VFLLTRSSRKKKNLKTKIKRYFFLNNLPASCCVKKDIENLKNKITKRRIPKSF